MSEEKWKERFEALVREAREIELGVYPQAWQGHYEKRTERMEGWNEAIMQYLHKFDEAVERATKALPDEDFTLLAASGDMTQRGDKLLVNISDTFAWASADAEPVPPEAVAELARLFSDWGRAGLLYWVSKQRGGARSEFKDVNRYIDFVAREEAWKKREPSSSKRAYTDIPDDLGLEPKG